MREWKWKRLTCFSLSPFLFFLSLSPFLSFSLFPPFPSFSLPLSFFLSLSRLFFIRSLRRRPHYPSCTTYGLSFSSSCSSLSLSLLILSPSVLSFSFLRLSCAASTPSSAFTCCIVKSHVQNFPSFLCLKLYSVLLVSLILLFLLYSGYHLSSLGLLFSTCCCCCCT